MNATDDYLGKLGSPEALAEETRRIQRANAKIRQARRSHPIGEVYTDGSDGSTLCGECHAPVEVRSAGPVPIGEALSELELVDPDAPVPYRLTELALAELDELARSGVVFDREPKP